ncbi:hypothetical protein C2S53_002921 [Perilla frutescens var. hirtella]|uniref:Uncharacterized protein n=1 Tax=Perilla frutescens var. hirtella TaxID=608512 RepID=A0AAD4J3T6_PERFH|nr:hypothetical protein C2S53_002921 [Perilla frutescens var. hirtella]
MQVYPNGGYTQNHYPVMDNDSYFCDDDYHYNNTVPWPPQNMQTRLEQGPPMPNQTCSINHLFKDNHQYSNGSSMPMNPGQWIPLHKTYHSNMDGYARHDHTENFKQGHQDYVARYPQFWGGEEQQYYTLNGRKGTISDSGNQYPGSVHLDVERSGGYGPCVPLDKQRRYSFEQNKAPPVWVTRGISE